jgi:hypothetical protein
LLLADDGRLALVANSNRGLVPGTGSNARQTISVINTAAALAQRPAVVGTEPAGLFPRDLSFDPRTVPGSAGQLHFRHHRRVPVPKAGQGTRS